MSSETRGPRGSHWVAHAPWSQHDHGNIWNTHSLRGLGPHLYAHNLHAGQSFTDIGCGDVHLVRNEGSVNAVLSWSRLFRRATTKDRCAVAP